MSIIQKQSNLQQSKNGDITTNLCEATHDSHRSDSGDVEGVVVIVVFYEETDFLVT